MVNQSGSPYLWVVKSPISSAVALKRETYNLHVIADHCEDKTRALAYPYVRSVIETPRFIYLDPSHPTHDAVRYIDLIFLPEMQHIQALVVIVERDKEPNEVATWMVKTNLKQEMVQGGIIYDSRANNQ
ncbi:hypothetical protein MTBGP_11150 [Moorella thermoacetica]|uniref:hypothetical protein n=1 Tax=Neomoorella thermoacetica TaxID=1525 RepID=UPI0030CC0FD5